MHVSVGTAGTQTWQHFISAGYPGDVAANTLQNHAGTTMNPQHCFAYFHVCICMNRYPAKVQGDFWGISRVRLSFMLVCNMHFDIRAGVQRYPGDIQGGFPSYPAMHIFFPTTLVLRVFFSPSPERSQSPHTGKPFPSGGVCPPKPTLLLLYPIHPRSLVFLHAIPLSPEPDFRYTTI